MRVLLVEDEQYLAEAIEHLLKRSDYKVDIASDGKQGLECARSGVYDALILDNMLPEMSGIEVLRALRKENNATPTLMLSAKSELSDKVEGLEVGADDYLAKPFKTAELIARLRAITRRHSHKSNDETLVGDVRVSTHDRMLRCGTKSIELTTKEFDLFDILAAANGKLVPTDTLFYRVWGGNLFVDPKYVAVYVSYLRAKLKKLGSKVGIKVVRESGYYLVGV